VIDDRSMSDCKYFAKIFCEDLFVKTFL